MTRAKISQYSATAGDNTDVNGVNIAEGCPPSSMNNMGREIMAALKRFQVGSDGDGVTVGGSLVVSGSTTIANTATLGNVDINGGAIDGTTIGGASAAAVTATTMSATVVQSDTISEKTSATGVTVDGVLLKDSGVVTGAGTVSAPVYSTTGDLNTGIFFPAADTIAFAEGGAEAMRINSDGQVGIGTTSPGVSLVVQASLGSQLKCIRTSGVTANFGSNSVEGFVLVEGANPLTFYTNGANERARITSGGSFVMGGTAAPTIAGVGAQHGAYGPAGSGSWAMGLQQDTTSAGGGRILGLRNVTDFNNASNEIIYYAGNTTERFSFVSNGGLRNYSANNVNLSDRREKTNFAPAKNYLDTICSIPVQTFNYIDQAEDDPGLTLGVVAQDVQEVAPELVMESNWGTQEEPKMRLAIYQTDLQYALMKSLQELKAINDAQASRIETLEAKVAALENA